MVVSMKPMKNDEILAYIWQRIERAGSQAALARECGISPQYLNYVISGRQEPGPKFLAGLGLSRVITYQEQEER